jgi:leukotriene-A4 hydrolase
VGNLAVKQAGPRATIIAEPGPLDDYARELSNVSGLLDMTEEYLTPYIWGTYSILVLPPSFPYGGMENPLLTFASPTIIVGDGSQVYVATHEIAHSWTGNEVTCKDWSNMWMNEGFTVFEERKVSERVHGEEFARIEGQLGNVSLWGDINDFGPTNNFSSLYPNLTDSSPDDSFSEVPYEKGFQFLTFLESLFDTKADFQQVIRAHINEHSQQSVTWRDFNETLTNWVKNNYAGSKGDDLLAKIDWQAWVYGPGPNPTNAGIDFTTAGAMAFEALADQYITLGGNASPSNFSAYLNTDDSQL